MPAIKLKKVTAEYLAEKEKEEKSKEKTKKNLEDVADEENAAKEEAKKDEEEDSKSRNFLEVEILYDKRKRTPPVVEQKLLDWLDSNLVKKEDVTLPLLTLYEYYSEVCQMQGENVVDVPVFNRYVREKFGKTLGFQENSPYRVLIKERKIQERKPKVQGETLQIKIRDIIINVINELGNFHKGLRFHAISRAIIQKYPAQRVDLYPNKLKKALERGVMAGYLENVKGVGMCGYYRVPGEPTKEDPDEKKDKKKKEKTGAGEEKAGEGEESKQNGEAGDSEEKSTDDEKKTEDKTEGEEGAEGKEDETKPEAEKKRKKKSKKKKKKPLEKWARSASKHSDPEKVEDVFPLAITYQSDPKEASGGKIKSYIGKYYFKDISNDKLKKALDKGVEDGMWELTSGFSPTGRYHLLIETFNPGRSDNLKDQIAQALVACHEPKQASAGLIKKYITEYHSKLNVEARPHLFKNALEKACAKGTLRQLSGIGATGTFQLADPFFPSPAILAGDSSDEEDLEDDDSDDEQAEYVPRPTKRGRMAPKPKPRQAPVPAPKRSKPRSRSAPPKKSAPRKGKERNSKSKSPKYYEVTSESESEVEEEVEYTPKQSKGRGAVATPAKKAAPVQEVKSTSKSRGKTVPKSDKKQSGKPRRAAAKSPAIVDVSDDESDAEEVAPAEYTPRPSMSRGGGSSGRQAATPKSTSRRSAKRKLVQESDADDDDSDVESPPPKKQRGKPTKESKEKEDEVEESEEETPPLKKQRGKPTKESKEKEDEVEESEEETPPSKKQKGGPNKAASAGKAQTPKSSGKRGKRKR
ncbi:nucleolar protein dao-5-like [Mercenaria mercenaria]|uniref:nucleolar protein dao-5-like n=1 Tax=Mercenaria mercenaria TaxID=6596 RepID=UPI00234F043C|nr:nucleolar protein dao-5-like [Mercenaria mercenaria]